MKPKNPKTYVAPFPRPLTSSAIDEALLTLIEKVKMPFDSIGALILMIHGCQSTIALRVRMDIYKDLGLQMVISVREYNYKATSWALHVGDYTYINKGHY
jgi:hypothetical protein